MSQLVPSVLPLDKGLDLQTAKIIAPPGSVLDSLNYEQVDFQGQKRIDGYTRYDGSVLSAFDDYAIVQFALETVYPGISSDVSEPVEINGQLWGVTLGPYGDNNDGAYVAVIDSNIEPEPGDSISINLQEVGSVTNAVTGLTSGVTAVQHYDKLIELLGALRSRVEHLPGPIAGLHWFRDRLYAVAMLQTFEIDTPAQLLNTEVQVGDYFTTVVEQTINTVSFITSDQLAPGDTVLLNGDSVGTLGAAVPNGDATFYESRTEQQAITEDADTGNAIDYGWRAKHLGWEVNFIGGIALYGDLASLNQNRQNVGIEGPTSTAGTNGSPAVLTQNISVTNAPDQVNGWKSHDSPTAYVLDARDVQLDDTAFVYADAYVQWTAESNAVLTPGSDMQGLVEASPTASVVYEPL